MTTLTDCPTCHEPIPFVWHGHHAVSSGHPEDDDPWCKHCGRPLNDMRSDRAEDYCTKAEARALITIGHETLSPLTTTPYSPDPDLIGATVLTEDDLDDRPRCPRCEDHGIITVAFGNYDTNEILCPDHEPKPEPDDWDDHYRPPMPGHWEWL